MQSPTWKEDEDEVNIKDNMCIDYDIFVNNL